MHTSLWLGFAAITLGMTGLIARSTITSAVALGLAILCMVAAILSTPLPA